MERKMPSPRRAQPESARQLSASPKRPRASGKQPRWMEAEELHLRQLMEGDVKISWAQVSAALGTERSQQSVAQHWKRMKSRDGTPTAASPARPAAHSKSPIKSLKAPSTAPHITAIRLLIGLLAFVLLLLANLAQHYWHPPVALCEEHAKSKYGGSDWRARFEPYVTGPDGVKKWTPAHEARAHPSSSTLTHTLTIPTASRQNRTESSNGRPHTNQARSLRQITHLSLTPTPL